MAKVGFEPTMFTARVLDLQSSAIATMRLRHREGFLLKNTQLASQQRNIVELRRNPTELYRSLADLPIAPLGFEPRLF